MSAADMVPQLLMACPTANAAWTAHLEYWGADTRGEFNDLAVFAHHVVARGAEHDTREFAAFFGLVEVFLSSPDQQIVGLAKYGLVETIQTIASNRPIEPTFFSVWCLDKTKVAWAGVAQEWEGKSSLAEVIRAEGSAKP